MVYYMMRCSQSYLICLEHVEIINIGNIMDAKWCVIVIMDVLH